MLLQRIKEKSMKRKHLFLGLALLLAAGGLWLARSGRGPENTRSEKPRTPYSQVLGGETLLGQTNNPRPLLAPPDQTRRFRDFTPEQRVQQARKGHGPGG